MNTSRLTALIAPLLACLALAPAFMPASAHAGTENRTVAEFQAISLNGGMDLVVRQGAQSVQVQADDKLLPLLETVVEGGALKVRWKRGESTYKSGKVLVTVSTPKLTALASSGSGDIQLEKFDTPALKVSLSGSGDARLEGLNTGELGISISGSSDVVGNGKATRVDVSIAGSGDVSLAGMVADDVQVRIAGSGDAKVNAQKSLDVRIAGSGDVTYVGNASVKSSVAGSGSINKK